MNTCANCGKSNEAKSNFCRFCGGRLVPGQVAAHEPFSPVSPRPYAWKTDEFATQGEARSANQTRYIDPGTREFESHNHGFPAAPMTPFAAPSALTAPIKGPLAIDPTYHCPRCGTSYLPVIERRISAAGWVVFSLLLVFTVIFFWVGLLMKENVGVCPVCRTKLC